MHFSHARRAALGALAALALVPVVACGQNNSAPAATATSIAATKPYTGELKALERKFDARLGLYAIDTGTGREVAYRDGERASASTPRSRRSPPGRCCASIPRTAWTR